MEMANGVALATAGTSDTAYARQDAKMNQGTIIVFVTRNPSVAAAMEAGVAATHDVTDINELAPKHGLN